MGESELEASLGQVFDAFPAEERAQLIAWAKTYVGHRWVLQRVYAEGRDEKGNVFEVEWKIGSPCPLDENLVIFAIVRDHEGIICAYSVGEAEGADGKRGKVYFKEQIYAPRSAFGPIPGDALYGEFGELFADADPEPDPPQKSNGAGAS